MKIDIQSGMKQAGEAIEKAAGSSKEAINRAVDSAKDNAKILAGKTREARMKADLKKYNPVFPDEYYSDDFCVPNVIVIVDDAVRRDVGVCRGAIGWRSKDKDLEILHLYDEEVQNCGLSFVPSAVCDTVYYVDPSDRTRFIQMSCLFDKIMQYRLAELADIAHCLGAKRYSVEMEEEIKTQSSFDFHSESHAKWHGKTKTMGVGHEENYSAEQSERHSRRALARAEYRETNEPVRPNLVWFRDEDNITKLIDNICCGERNLQAVDIELYCANSATMSGTTAAKIDSAMKKLGIAAEADVQKRAAEERSQKMIFHLEF